MYFFDKSWMILAIIEILNVLYLVKNWNFIQIKVIRQWMVKMFDNKLLLLNFIIIDKNRKHYVILLKILYTEFCIGIKWMTFWRLLIFLTKTIFVTLMIEYYGWQPICHDKVVNLRLSLSIIIFEYFANLFRISNLFSNTNVNIFGTCHLL